MRLELCFLWEGSCWSSGSFSEALAKVATTRPNSCVLQSKQLLELQITGRFATAPASFLARILTTLAGWREPSWCLELTPRKSRPRDGRRFSLARNSKSAVCSSNARSSSPSCAKREKGFRRLWTLQVLPRSSQLAKEAQNSNELVARATIDDTCS